MKETGSKVGFIAVALFWAGWMAFSSVSHNPRGKWLIEQKEKHKAAEVDPAWLKDYPGGK